mmetsp:Transcript_20628/g.29121  ORF Transcript_20628/g.29121 Transcript_20628/m.29121 type:complete len:226 (-) Transcript_20628:556-1233(-)
MVDDIEFSSSSSGGIKEEIDDDDCVDFVCTFLGEADDESCFFTESLSSRSCCCFCLDENSGGNKSLMDGSPEKRSVSLLLLLLFLLSLAIALPITGGNSVLADGPSFSFVSMLGDFIEEADVVSELSFEVSEDVAPPKNSSHDDNPLENGPAAPLSREELAVFVDCELSLGIGGGSNDEKEDRFFDGGVVDDGRFWDCCCCFRCEDCDDDSGGGGSNDDVSELYL